MSQKLTLSQMQKRARAIARAYKINEEYIFIIKDIDNKIIFLNIEDNENIYMLKQSQKEIIVNITIEETFEETFEEFLKRLEKSLQEESIERRCLDYLSIKARLNLFKAIQKQKLSKEENKILFEELNNLENASYIYIHSSYVYIYSLDLEDEEFRTLNHLLVETILNLNELFELISHYAFKQIMRQLHFTNKQKNHFISKM